jgi:hypothetical protein
MGESPLSANKPVLLVKKVLVAKLNQAFTTVIDEVSIYS